MIREQTLYDLNLLKFVVLLPSIWSTLVNFWCALEKYVVFLSLGEMFSKYQESHIDRAFKNLLYPYWFSLSTCFIIERSMLKSAAVTRFVYLIFCSFVVSASLFRFVMSYCWILTPLSLWMTFLSLAVVFARVYIFWY